MRKVIVCALVSAAFAVFALTPSAALAQKDKVKDKGKAVAAVIEVNESEKDGKFRFVIRNGEGKAVALSPVSGFATEKDAMKAIEDLKAILAGTPKIVKKAAKGTKDK